MQILYTKSETKLLTLIPFQILYDIHKKQSINISKNIYIKAVLVCFSFKTYSIPKKKCYSTILKKK